MVMDVTMPDGTVITGVPDGTTKAELLRLYQTPAAPPVTPAPTQAAATAAEGERRIAVMPEHPNPLAKSFLGRVLHGATGGATAVLQGVPWVAQQAATWGTNFKPNPVSEFFGRGHKEIRRRANAVESNFQQTRNALAPSGDAGFDVAGLLGAVVDPVALAATPMRALAPARSLTAAGARVGAIGGALTPVYGEGDFLDEKAKQVALGTAFGSVAGPVLSGTARALGGRGGPTTHELTAARNAAYADARAAGVAITPRAFQDLIDRLEATAADAGVTHGVHPGAIAALNAFRTNANPPPLTPGTLHPIGVPLPDDPYTLDRLDNLRRAVRDAAPYGTPDGRIGGLVVDELDDFLNTLGPGHLVSGDPRAVRTLTRARALARQAFRDEDIQTIINGAQHKDFGKRTDALRAGFRALAANPKKMARFTPDERAAINNVGGGLVKNALGLAARLSPRTALGAITTGLGGVINPALLALNAAGAAADVTRTVATRRAATAAGETMRGGTYLNPTIQGIVNTATRTAAQQPDREMQRQRLNDQLRAAYR